MESPVSDRRGAMESKEAYGWYSQKCVENADSRVMVYEKVGGGSVVALGVCQSASLENIMWEDKMCVGLVKPSTAQDSSLEGYLAYMAVAKDLR
jgi:hypothetical protein